ncbi:MAG: HAD family hydrolase [Coriobacteriales bacterium]|jgi:HAD superfamily hydrolase (TIGR01509 family)
MFEKFSDASGIIFDCDGTLLDSMKAWRHVEFSLIDMTGVTWTQEMLEHMRAAAMSEACRIFHEDYGVMDSNEDIRRYMEQTMCDYYENKAEFRPGAREFFWRLRGLGIPCSVVSSTPARYLRPAMEHVGIIDELAALISTEESGLSKQDPAIYKLALDKMGAEIPTAWGFEDSLYAIRVMGGMGISTVGCYEDDDSGTFEELQENATIAVRSFEELLV